MLQVCRAADHVPLQHGVTQKPVLLCRQRRSPCFTSSQTISRLCCYFLQTQKVKLSLSLTKQGLRCEVLWGSGCVDPHFLDLGISLRCGQLHAPAVLPPGKRTTVTHWIGSWVGPIAALDDMEK
jgi:hypothetical protein